VIGSGVFHLIVIPEAERSEAVRNPAITAPGYWVPGSPLRGARNDDRVNQPDSV
jgi:hypothetical protein